MSPAALSLLGNFSDISGIWPNTRYLLMLSPSSIHNPLDSEDIENWEGSYWCIDKDGECCQMETLPFNCLKEGPEEKYPGE